MGTVFEMAAPRGSEVGGVMVGGVEDEGDAAVPQVMGLALAVSIKDGCADVKSGGGYSWWEFCGGEWLCWWWGVVEDIVLGKLVQRAEETCCGGGAGLLDAGVYSHCCAN
jgi:hypothetical protein